MKILTVCSQGLVRSVAMMDVLKMHFEPIDVIAVGIDSNSRETMYQMMNWADHVISMHEPFYTRMQGWLEHEEVTNKPTLHLCEVGSDTYHNSRHRSLIDQSWDWARKNCGALGVTEHTRRV